VLVALRSEEVASTGKAGSRSCPDPRRCRSRLRRPALLLAASDALAVKATAAAFNRADKEDVATSLDALVALGLAVAFGKGEERRWRAAGRVAA